jgi:hypothetical protein
VIARWEAHTGKPLDPLKQLALCYHVRNLAGGLQMEVMTKYPPDQWGTAEAVCVRLLDVCTQERQEFRTLMTRAMATYRLLTEREPRGNGRMSRLQAIFDRGQDAATDT